MKQITKDFSKWVEALCSQMGKLNVLKISVLPNMIYHFNTISTQIPTFHRNWAADYKIHIEKKG